MSESRSSVLLPVSAGVLAVRQDRRVSHILTAVDDAGARALEGLSRLIPAGPTETAAEPGLDTVRISVGEAAEPGLWSDLHVCVTAHRTERSEHRGARLRVSTAAELPMVLDDLVALTEPGLIAVSPDELGWMLRIAPRAAGAYVSMPLESHRWLGELRNAMSRPELLVASVRVPGLRPGDELGFEALSQVQLTFEAAPHILINAVPARRQAAHIGLCVWP